MREIEDGLKRQYAKLYELDVNDKDFFKKLNLKMEKDLKELKEDQDICPCCGRVIDDD